MATARRKRTKINSAPGNEPTTPLGQRILADLAEHIAAIESGAPLRVRTVTLDLTAHRYGPNDVRRVRDALGMSQAVFAAFLGIDATTVRAWEQGRREPSGMARRFLEEIEASPRHWATRVKDKIKPKGV